MVEFFIEDQIATIHLNRSEKKNALNYEMVSELKSCISDCINDEDVKIIVLKGKGDVFSAGADLSSLQKLQTASFQDNVDDSKHLAELFKLIYLAKKPFIAVVHGHAIAGGCGLATVCDITLVSEEAKLGYTETRIGFVPAIVSRFILEKVGLARATDLLLSGRLIDAKEAKEMGLITDFAKKEDFNDLVEKWINMLRTKTSKDALFLTKSIIRSAEELPFDSFIDHAIVTNANARSTEDCQKGIAAFLNKEKLNW